MAVLLEVLVRYAHFLGILLLAGTLAIELMLFKRELDRDQIQRLARIDGVYGFAAVLTLAAGLSLWWLVGKPAEYYTRNGIFHLKLTLFVIMGLLSIRPTLFLLKHRRHDSAHCEVPKSMRMTKHVEMLLLILIPLLAALMARGFGSA